MDRWGLIGYGEMG
jgi:hypothetical protein